MLKSIISYRLPILISAGLFLLLLIAFEPIRHNDFIYYDDDKYITENSHIQSGFNCGSVIWAFTSFQNANWHPLTWLSHMLDIELFGLNPPGHHLHNLLLHITSTILLFWLLYRMTRNIWPAAFVAMLFGIHPLRVESVAWASERKDVLSMLFFMLTVAAYLYYVRQKEIKRYLLVLLCFALGLMAKPMLVTLPFVLLLLDFWPLERIHEVSWQNSPISQTCDSHTKSHRSASLTNLFIEKIPFFFLVIVSCIITYAAQISGGSVGHVNFYARISNSIIGYITYLIKTFRPSGLVVLYPYPSTPYAPWLLGTALTSLLIITAAAILARRKYPCLITGWFWYLITLVPVIGLVRIGMQSAADRYTYLPSIGLYIMFVWFTDAFCSRRKLYLMTRWILTVLIAAVLIVYTRAQLTYWKDSVSLFEHTLATTHNNFVIHNNLGRSLFIKGKIDQALVHFETAAEMDPGFYPAYLNIALVKIKQQKHNEAMTYLQKTLNIVPDNAGANLAMGQFLLEQQQLEQALKYFRRVLQAKPDTAEAYYNIGTILATQGENEQAARAYEQAIRYQQNYYNAYNNLGAVRVQQGLLDEAVLCFEQSIKINPKYAPPYRNIGLILQIQGQDAKAVFYFQTALSMSPQDIAANYGLACSLHKIGRLQEALQFYRISLTLNPDSSDTLNRLAWILSTSSDIQFQNPSDAVSLARKACELTSYEDFESLDTLSAAYAAAGLFKEAIETAQKAVTLAHTAGRTDMVADISDRLKLYQSGKPYYE